MDFKIFLLVLLGAVVVLSAVEGRPSGDDDVRIISSTKDVTSTGKRRSNSKNNVAQSSSQKDSIRVKDSNEVIKSISENDPDGTRITTSKGTGVGSETLNENLVELNQNTVSDTNSVETSSDKSNSVTTYDADDRPLTVTDRKGQKDVKSATNAKEDSSEVSENSESETNWQSESDSVEKSVSHPVCGGAESPSSGGPQGSGPQGGGSQGGPSGQGQPNGGIAVSSAEDAAAPQSTRTSTAEGESSSFSAAADVNEGSRKGNVALAGSTAYGRSVTNENSSSGSTQSFSGAAEENVASPDGGSTQRNAAIAGNIAEGQVSSKEEVAEGKATSLSGTIQESDENSQRSAAIAGSSAEANVATREQTSKGKTAAWTGNSQEKSTSPAEISETNIFSSGSYAEGSTLSREKLEQGKSTTWSEESEESRKH
uniref:SP2 n=1 Tax=Apotrechus illawarra TaxID=992432 RepID=H6B9K0_9ORTH|nr:SP2 precursor [Apotrechus illawarra]